jgi:MFS family permease
MVEKSATSGRLLVALVGGQLGVHAVMAGLRMAIPLQLLREGYSPWAVGALLSLFALAPVLSALPAGRLADRLGYHTPVYLSVAAVVLGGLMAVASTWAEGHLHFALLCGAAMATGAGANTGNLVIQRTAGLAATNSVERVRVFSWLGIAPSFSNVVGPVLAGVVIDASGFRAAYLALLLLPLPTLWAAHLVPRRFSRGSLRRPVATDSTSAAPTPRRTSWDLLQAPGMKRLLMVNWLLSSCWDVHTFALPVLGHERGYSASTIGFILGTFTLSVTVVRLFIPLLAHRLSEVVVLRSAMVATGLIFALYPFAPTPLWMGVCAIFLGVSLGSVQPMVLSTLHQLTPDGRHGEALALRSMALNGSSTLMPLVFGATGTALGAAVLFWAVGAAVAAGSGLARGLPKANR